MTTERHARLSRLFLDAVDLDAGGREALLDRECRDDPDLREEVLDLIRADGAEAAALDPLPSSARFPDVPGYRLIRQIGRGGMGVVFEAEQESPQRAVALKVLRLDGFTPELLRRFAREANVLAQLENPAIARIYHFGTARAPEGLPFFAMELIHGVQVHQYAADRALGARDRLALFARICDGVEYAHQKEILHRDLKPGNILVTDAGEPKILDFGIARALHADGASATSQTDAGQIIGTLAYMSPEQATGPGAALDARSDVYSLGVILYYLMTGTLPLDLRDRAFPEAARVIRDVEPKRAGALDPALRGDVETIIAKALDKDRDHRYQTAAELAADIRRHLRDEPIVASPTSAFVALRKFARRNRALVAGLAAAALALIAGTIVSIVFAVRARDSAARSAREAQTSRRLMEFVTDTFRGLDPNNALGREPTLRDAMDAMSARLEKGLDEEPAIRARLHSFAGSLYMGLGRIEEAAKHHERAIALHRTTGVQDVDFAGALYAAAWLDFRLRRLDEADALAVEGLQILDAAGIPESGNAATLIALRSEIALDRGDLKAAIEGATRALAMRRRILPADHEMIATSLLVCGRAHEIAGDLATAEPLLAESLAMRRRLFGDVHPLIAESLNALSAVYFRQDDFDRVVPMMMEAIQIREETLPAGHPAVATGYANLAYVSSQRGDHAGALTWFDKALVVVRTAYGEGGAQVGDILVRRGQAAMNGGLLPEAEANVRDGLRILDAPGGPAHPAARGGHETLAFLHMKQGRPREALAEFATAYPREVAAPTGGHAGFMVEIGAAACKIGDHETALEALEPALPYMKDPATERRMSFLGRLSLGIALKALGRKADAEPHLRAALLLADELEEEQRPGARARVLEALNDL